MTGAQLAGQWDGTLIIDDDLRTDPSAPFAIVHNTFTISDLGSNNILLDFGGGKTMNATISGDIIVPTDPAFDYFRMITDGNTFVAAGINAEDVPIGAAAAPISAGIAMGTLIPEPVTAGLLALGGLALLRRRRRI